MIDMAGGYIGGYEIEPGHPPERTRLVDSQVPNGTIRRLWIYFSNGNFKSHTPQYLFGPMLLDLDR